MNFRLSEGIHKVAIALASLWFWNREDGEFMRLYVYSKHLETNHPILSRKRIAVEIRIEDDPMYKTPDGVKHENR